MEEGRKARKMDDSNPIMSVSQKGHITTSRSWSKPLGASSLDRATSPEN